MSGTVDCKAQPYGMEQKRTMVLQHEMDFLRRVRPYQSPDMIEKRVDLVQRLKVKMLHVAGLGEHVSVCGWHFGMEFGMEDKALVMFGLTLERLRLRLMLD